jgi:type IV pilus assembly protein PilY1
MSMRFALWGLIASGAFVHAGVVSQDPLLSKTVNVKPNIALMLDTSGSMGWDCVYAKHVTEAFVKENSTMYGLVTSCLGTSDIRQVSPVNNLLYYNPKKTYMPGFVGGVQQGNASVGATSVVTLYLPIPPKDPTTYTTSAAIKNPANYDLYEVTTTGFKKNGVNKSTNPLGSHGGARKDCGNNDPCTLTQERQNIANWRAYHINRMAAAKTGLSAAFSQQIDNFRLAYTDIYSNLNTMRDWDVAKSNYYTWLDNRTANGGTPLREALIRAGDYYKDKTGNTGPWGSKPWSPPSGETAASHLSCRRSYTMLITDGFYTDNDPSTISDVDGSTGTKYVHALDSNKSYQYVPRSADLRSKGKADLTTSGGYSKTLADIAMKYWVTDLRSDLPNDAGRGDPSDPPFWQNMTTYMVSFGAPGKMTDAQVAQAKAGTVNWAQPVGNTITTIDDMRHAAHNGGGDFLRVNDAEQFAKDLGSVIGSIASQEYSQAGVAASAVTLTAGTKKFVPYYTSGTWWGNLEMVNLSAAGDSTGFAWRVVATDANGQPTGTTTIPSPSARNIVVWVDQTKQAIDFNYTNITAGTNNLRGSNANMQMSSSVSSDVIDYLRGVRTKEGTTMRKRSAILGDIVNSTPVFIKNNTNPEYEKLPAGTPGLSSYAAYMTAKANRTEGALLVGANDGMVHAFGEGYGTKVGGREIFAYVPRSTLGKLEQLTLSGYAYAHTFTVDGPLNEADAYITTPNVGSGGSSTGWRNVVLGTAGAGAKTVFAINATDPTSYSGKSVLWEINADSAFPTVSTNASTAFQNLGHVFSPVQSGITASGDWVSIFGNGFGSSSGKASLFIVETSTGKLLKEITTDSSTNNGLGGVRLVQNSQKQIIGAYAGDLLGRLWKFDLSGASSIAWQLGNGGTALFTATKDGTPLPITAQPAVMERTDQAAFNPSYLVSFGTGKLFEVGDANITTPTQHAYAIWDRRLFGSSTSDSVSDASLEELKVKKVDIGAGSGDSLNSGGVTSFYTVEFANSSTTAMNWATKRGWKLPLSVFSGQRNVYPSNIVGEVVKLDTVAPQASSSSCQASTSNAATFLINPLTAGCRGGGTLDTNGDGEIDDNDASVCAYTTNADGMDVTLIILNSQGIDSGLRDVQNSTGHIKIRTSVPPPRQDCSNPVYAASHLGECGTCADPAYAAAHPDSCTTPPDCTSAAYRLANPRICPGATLNRSWRQIFPRANN